LSELSFRTAATFKLAIGWIAAGLWTRHFPKV
jgi:hypothetical protein